MAGEYHHFGPFVYDRVGGTLTRDGKAVALGSRASALLGALVAARGAAVSKDELIEAAWPGTIVEEGNLSVQIAALRKALGTREDGLEWIATVPRVGYRLVRGGEASALRAGERPMPSLAVLPFVNLSGDPEQEHFANGVVVDIIAALSRFKTFAVMDRNSSFAFKGLAAGEVAEALKADYVLEGSVRRAGNRLRITAQLAAATSGATLWAKTFDGVADDVFEMQERIAAGVAAAVDPEIYRAEAARSLRERPDSVAAYDLYLRGREKLNTLLPEDSREGIGLLEKAMALDPGFTKAIAMAAWGYEYRLHTGLEPLGPDDNGKCLRFARSALATAGDDAAVIAHCGVILQLCAHEWEQGLRTIERAITLNPSNVTCQFFAGVGHLKGGSLEAAMGYFERAIELNPVDSARSLAGTGHVQLCLGQYEDALERGGKALAADQNFAWIHWLVIAANAYLGRAEQATKALALYRSIFPEATISRIRLGQVMKDPERAKILPNGLVIAGMPGE